MQLFLCVVVSWTLLDVVGAVDFLVGLSVSVRRYHSKDVKYETITKTLSLYEYVFSVDYHLSKNLLFVRTRNKIIKSPMVPMSNNTVVKTTILKSEGFAVDWVHDRIYCADYTDPNDRYPSIVTFGLDGENQRIVITLKELLGKYLKRMEIDPYEGRLFCVIGSTVMSVDTSGTNFNGNLTRPEMSVRAIALDLKHRRVYFVATVNKTTSLYSVDYDGEGELEHFSLPQLTWVSGLSVLGDKVFWVSHANNRKVVYEAPLNLTRANDVKAITTIDSSVWHMRVVHPLLQRQPQLDPCQDKGCSHTCKSTGVASATCSCPAGYSLQDDGVSCFQLE